MFGPCHPENLCPPVMLRDRGTQIPAVDTFTCIIWRVHCDFFFGVLLLEKSSCASEKPASCLNDEVQGISDDDIIIHSPGPA